MSQPLGKLEHIGARSGHHLLSLRGRGRASLRPEVPRRVRSMKFGAGLRPPTGPHPVTLQFAERSPQGGCPGHCVPWLLVKVRSGLALGAWAFTCSSEPASS